METALRIEEIAALLQWRYPVLPTELWLVVALLRLSMVRPQNHPAFLHLIDSVKRVWRQRFRVVEPSASLVLFLPDPAIKLRRAVLAHFARRYVSTCVRGHAVAAIEVSFTGRKRDEKRMRQRTMNWLRVDPRRDYVYREAYGRPYETYHALHLGIMLHCPNESALLESSAYVHRYGTPLWCLQCYPTPAHYAYLFLESPNQYFPNSNAVDDEACVTW
jgi:hypothetical protein